MKVSEVKKLCASFTAVTLSEKGEPANILSYQIGGKNFAYFKTSEPEKWRFSVRVSPDRFLELTDQPGVKPARYMHRFHWVTIVDVSAFDSTYLTELINWSYRKACLSLSKRLKRELGVNDW